MAPILGSIPSSGYNAAKMSLNPSDPDYLRKLGLVTAIEGQHELDELNSMPQHVDVPSAPAPAPTKTIIGAVPQMGGRFGAGMAAANRESSAQLGYGDKVASLKHTIANDPDPYNRANAQAQLDELQRQNPWGSPANKPGILGKIAHVAATAGNVAGDVLAPSQMAMIPGTQLHRDVEQAGAEREVAAAARSGLERTQAAVAPVVAETNLLKAQAGTKTPFTYRGPNGEPETGFTDKAGNKYDKNGVVNPDLTAYQHGVQGELTDADVASLNAINQSNWAVNFPGQKFPGDLAIKPGSSQAVIKSINDSLKQRYAQQAQSLTSSISKKYPLLAEEYPAPDAAKYADGAADPGYHAAQRAWAHQIDRINQAQQMALAQARGAGFELERPQPVIDPDTGATLGEWVPGDNRVIPAPGQTAESVLDAIGNGGLAARLPGATLGRQAAARSAIQGARNLDEDIPKMVRENPEIVGNLGAIANALLTNTPLADPTQNRLAGELKSFAAQQGAAHGMRGQGVLEDFLRGLSTVKNEKALVDYIDGIARGLEPIATTGIGGGRAAAPPSAPPTPPAAADVVQTGTLGGKKVYKLKNGSVVYADGTEVPKHAK